MTRNKIGEQIKREQEERERQEQLERAAAGEKKKSEPYSPRCATVAQGMAMRGCKQKEIAKALGVSQATVTVWKERHPEFADALRTGREMAADLLRGTALQLATGTFRHVEKKLVFNKEEGCFDVQSAEITLPPDSTTLKFMLSRMDPEFGDTQDINLHGDGGIQVNMTVREGA